MWRRVTISVALVLALLGALAWSAPAQAGDVDSNSGVLSAAIYDATPYPMTLVASYSANGWTTSPGNPGPGGGSLFQLNSSGVLGGGICFGTWKTSFDGYMTYRIDVLGGPAEYLTVAIYGNRSYSAAGCGDFAPAGDVYPSIDVYDTTAPPPAGWTGPNGAPAVPATAHPQINYSHNVPYLFDQTFGVEGNWTVDARSPLGHGFDDLLNTICGQSPASCTFTQNGPLTWGEGAPTASGESINCAKPGTSDFNLFQTDYSATQESSLTVGGGVTLSTEVKLFDLIGSKISVRVEAEHEWTQTNTFTRTASIEVPPRGAAIIWAAPTIGTVTGTMQVRFGSSMFTVTNFSQTRSGVTKDDLTPAYDSITEVRPATGGELAQFCPASRAAHSGRAHTRALPTVLPGRGVGDKQLGRVRDTHRLGKPLIKSARANASATANDCLVLDPQCAMVAGRGGTWVYRDLSVVFGADHRISALIYSGRGRTPRGVGVGSGLRSVRTAYPGLSCARYPGATTCALRGSQGTGPTRTVFHFDKSRNRMVCDRVMIYRVDTSSERWAS